MEPESTEPPTTAAVVDRFGCYLKELGEPYTVEGWSSLSGGRSAETVGVRLAGGAAPLDVVLSLQNATGPLAGITDIARQFEVMEAVASTGVRVPRTLWCSATSEAVGRPFMVTELVKGVVPDPWRAHGREFLAAARHDERLLDDIVMQLVAIHDVAPETLPPSALGATGSTGVRHELDQWNTVRADSAFADDPVMTYAGEWLAVHEPAESMLGLFHGDFRVGNLLIEGGRVAAVLDWEFSQLGDPRLDVATLESPAFVVNGLQDGLWPDGEFARRYERLSGRAMDPVTFEYFRRLATFKVVSVWVNSSRAFTRGAPDIRALRGGFSVLDTRPMLAEVMGLALPPPSEFPASRAARATGLLADVLRGEVRPALSQGDPSREAVDFAIATLRGMSNRAATGAEREFELDAGRLLDDLAVEFGDQLGDPDAPPTTRLAQAIRAVLGPLEHGGGADALSQRLRDLVGRASRLSLGIWP